MWKHSLILLWHSETITSQQPQASSVHLKTPRQLSSFPPSCFSPTVPCPLIFKRQRDKPFQNFFFSYLKALLLLIGHVNITLGLGLHSSNTWESVSCEKQMFDSWKHFAQFLWIECHAKIENPNLKKTSECLQCIHLTACRNASYISCFKSSIEIEVPRH